MQYPVLGLTCPKTTESCRKAKYCHRLSSKQTNEEHFQLYDSSERCEDENGLKVDEALLLKAVGITVTPGSWADVEKLPFTKRIL